MFESACSVVGLVDAVVPALWQSVQVGSLCSAWLPVAGPYACILFGDTWHAAQPLPVVPHVGVVIAVVTATYGLA